MGPKLFVAILLALAAGSTTALAVAGDEQVTASGPRSPQLEWTAPTGGTLAGHLTADAGCRVAAIPGDSPIDHVKFRLDGEVIGRDYSAPFGCDWDTASAENGSQHTLKAVAYDAEGDSARASVTVTVDREGPAPGSNPSTSGPRSPQLEWTAPTGGTVAGHLTADAGCRVVAIPGDSPIDHVKFRLDGQTFDRDYAPPFGCDLNTASVDDGSHTLRAIGYDAEQDSARVSVNVTVDQEGSPPTTSSTTSTSSSSTTSSTSSTSSLSTTTTSTHTGTITISPPPTTTTSTTTAPPPLPQPAGISLYFPMNPLPVGTPLPKCAGEHTLPVAGFDQLDYDQDDPQALDYVADPGGSGKSVVRFRVSPSSTADCSGAPTNDRAEVYSSKEVFGGGIESWQLYGVRVDEADHHSMFSQMHSPHGCGPPPMSQNINDGDLVVTARIGTRSDYTKQTFKVMNAPRHHWLYEAVHAKWTTATNGFFEAWGAVDHLPNVSQPPQASKYGYASIYTGSCGSGKLWPKVGIYNVDQPEETFLCGYHSGASWAEVRILPSCPL